jgi:chromosome segregation ATPase
MEHGIEVKRLQSELVTCRGEVERQTKKNNALQSSLKVLMQKLDEIQNENKHLNANNNALTEKMKALEEEKEELKNWINDSIELNKEQMRKSQESNEKMQEMIKVVEVTLAENQELTFENSQIKDELDNISRTIGSVIEEASEKYDKERKAMLNMHKQELESSKSQIEHLEQMLECEKSKASFANEHAKSFEEKLNSIGATNTFISHDLQAALEKLVKFSLIQFFLSLTFVFALG